jgi:ubiquinone/menaquinone biosynthesis C-methylase UbiE
LDVGTGSGLFAEAFAAAGLAVTGIDTNPDMLLAAREFVPSARMVQATFEELPFDDASFDIVFLGHVLHETDDLLQALEEARRVARLRVCVLEWPFIGEEQGPPLHHRLDPDDVLLAAAASGFTQVERITLGHMEYFRFSVL